MTTTLTRVATYELKAIKEFTGRDGYGLNANLYRDGKKIASILDEGNGGSLFFTFDDRAIELTVMAELHELGLTVKPVYIPADFDMAELYVNHLIEVAANNRLSKKAVAFRKTNESDTNIFINKEVFCIALEEFTREEVIDYIRSHYPDGYVWDVPTATWKEVI